MSLFLYHIKSKTAKIIINWIVAAIILLFIFFKLYHEIAKTNFSEIIVKVVDFKLMPIILSLFLVYFNWALDALKWKLLLKNHHTISFNESLKIVLSGLSVGFLTPGRLGDVFYRVYYNHLPNKTSLFFSLYYARFSQFIITVFFGIIGLIYVFRAYKTLFIIFLIAYLVFVLIYMLLHKKITLIVCKYLLKKHTPDYSIDFGDFIKALTVSFTRYIVFSTQFVLILYAFNLSNNFLQLYNGVFATYLLKSSLPFFSLFGEFGLREFSAIFIFNTMGISSVLVFFSSFLLWCFNIVIPSIIGVFFIKKRV